MKHRLFAALFISCTALSMMLPLFGLGTAIAASPASLAYYYDPNNVAAMKTSASKSSPDDTGFSGSAVLVQGGFFGSGTKFTYARETSQNYQYIFDYYCVNGTPQAQKPSGTKYYSLELSTYLLMDGSFDSKASYPQGASNDTYSTGLSHATQYDSKGNVTTQSSDVGGGLVTFSLGGGNSDIAEQGNGQTNSVELPTNCLNPYNQLRNAPGPMVNLAAASQSTQAAWKNALNATGTAQIGGNPGGTGTGSGTTQLSCDGSLTSSLTWFLCPVIDLMTHAIDAVDGWITSQLDINTNQIFCTTSDCSKSDQTTSNDYYAAWSTFRNIALGLMAIAGLVIVIAQALGIEILDAYTLRKALPRLLIAAIGITLSWPLMSFMVNLSNDLGVGIRHLIYAPFSNLKDQVGFGFGGGVDGGIENFATGMIGSAVAIGATIMMLPVLFSLFLSASLAVFVALLVLILRQVAIILLILVAPIAIVLYILPNTQKAYQIWWDSFAKALMMFPIIAGFIAAGRVFSAVSLASPDILHQIIGFAAYFAPYFLIPATFKLAGGAIRQLGGFVNDRGRGAFDRLRNGRAKQMSQIGQNVRNAQAFRVLGANRPESLKRVERGLQNVSHVGEAGINPLGWRRNVRSAVNKTDQKRLGGLDNEEEMALILGNDDLSQAAVEANGNTSRMRDILNAKSDKYTPDDVNGMIGAYDRSRASLAKKGYSPAAIDRGMLLNGLKAKTAFTSDDYWEDAEYTTDENGKRKRVDGTGTYVGAARVLEHIQRLSGGDPNVEAQMISKAIDITTASGRPELVAGFSESWKGVKDIAKTAGGTEAQKKDTRVEVAKRLARKVIYKNGAQAVIGANAHATRHLIGTLQETLGEAAQTFETAKTGATVQIYNPDTDTTVNKSGAEAVALAERNLKQVVAQVAFLQDNNGSMPAEKQGLVGEFIGRSIGTPVTIEDRPAPQAASGPETRTAGGVILPTGVTAPAAPAITPRQVSTVQDLLDHYRGDKETQQFKYDLYAKNLTEQRNLSPTEQALLADQQATRGGQDPGSPPVPPLSPDL